MQRVPPVEKKVGIDVQRGSIIPTGEALETITNYQRLTVLSAQPMRYTREAKASLSNTYLE